MPRTRDPSASAASPTGRAVVAGASGLVGTHVLELLLKDERTERVTALVRRPLGLEHGKLREVLVDFERLADAPDLEAENVFCCLGTTMRTAGSKDAFRRVDLDYVVALASFAEKSGSRRFLAVSSSGASAKSPVFYSRVKGEMEEAISRLAIPAVHVFRPSFLMGDRKERRPGERAALAAFSALSFALIGPLRKARPIDARTVARAMVAAAHDERTGRFVHESAEIEAIASGR